MFPASAVCTTRLVVATNTSHCYTLHTLLVHNQPRSPTNTPTLCAPNTQSHHHFVSQTATDLAHSSPNVGQAWLFSFIQEYTTKHSSLITLLKRKKPGGRRLRSRPTHNLEKIQELRYCHKFKNCIQMEGLLKFMCLEYC